MFAIDDSVQHEINYGNASAIVAIEEPLIGVSSVVYHFIGSPLIVSL